MSKNPWPTTEEWVALTLAVPDGFPLCDCGVPEGESDATDPNNRDVHLPHHFDCSAVEAWRFVVEWLRDNPHPA